MIHNQLANLVLGVMLPMYIILSVLMATTVEGQSIHSFYVPEKLWQCENSHANMMLKCQNNNIVVPKQIEKSNPIETVMIHFSIFWRGVL